MTIDRLTRAGNTQPGITAKVDELVDAVNAGATTLAPTGPIVAGTYVAAGTFMAVTQSPTAPVLAISGTIASAYGVSRVAPAGNVTAVILAAGSRVGQICTVRNESAFTVTFDDAGTSLVADGASSAIPALCERRFTWSGTLWYRAA
jgi:hypothetical protein